MWGTWCSHAHRPTEAVFEEGKGSLSRTGGSLDTEAAHPIRRCREIGKKVGERGVGRVRERDKVGLGEACTSL